MCSCLSEKPKKDQDLRLAHMEKEGRGDERS